MGQSCSVRAHETFSQINTIYNFPVSSRNIYKADYTLIIINRFVADIFPLNPSSFTLFPEVSFHNFSILPRLTRGKPLYPHYKLNVISPPSFMIFANIKYTLNGETEVHNLSVLEHLPR